MVKRVSTDVEMKDVSSPSKSGKSEKPEKMNGVEVVEIKDVDLLTLEDIKEYIKYIEKSVVTKEPRYMSRVIRGLRPVRAKLNTNVLRKLLKGYMTAQAQQRDELNQFLAEPLEENGPGPVFRPRSGKQMNSPLLPEIEVYLHLLVLIHLIDNKDYEKAVMCSEILMNKIQLHNRRTLNQLAAKCYFYHARAYELTQQQDRIRVFLHNRLQTAVLRSDHDGQASLLNLLLRNYLHYNLIEQADKLVSKSTFPDLASNNEWARFLFYLGKIKATQLEYSEAHKHLLQALRKAPQHSAIGFKQNVQRLAVVVELLLGDIPDREVFRQPILKKTLDPYFQLTQAVRSGDLPNFNQVLTKYGDKFQAEGTYTLIIRLRHNVIKAGVRRINMSYSRISLMDIAQKLALDSPEDAEYIVAKAIRDGVIEATIDHEKGYVQSKETSDIYATQEPMAAFHQRITFCLDIHNHSVKAMRFPPKSYNKDLESAEVSPVGLSKMEDDDDDVCSPVNIYFSESDERREREQQELESAKEIADEDFDGFP